MGPPERVDVVVVGDLMVDVSVSARDLAAGGDVHGEVRLRPGGSAGNAAAWAAACGARVRVHGRVGDDVAGRVVVGALSGRGVDCAVTFVTGARTGAMLVVNEGGERSMVADRGANSGLLPSELPERIEGGAVLVSGYLLFDPASERGFRAALERAVADVVAVDAASWPLVDDYGADRFLEVTKGATLLLANDREARSLTGLRGADAAVRLAERYEAACVKLGSRGAALVRDGEIHVSTAPPIEAVDPTGAGDAFDGALLAALAAGAPIPGALRAACEAGARAAASHDAWPGP